MSLEGLNSLIQLESGRLEAAKQTSSNFQSVSSTTQQQGLAAAQSKSSLSLNKITSEYDKDVAASEVRRIERKLVRERKAEQLAMTTAMIVTVASGLSNIWDAGQDLFNKRQKPGEIPDYMKSPNIDPALAVQSTSRIDGSAGNRSYISGPSKGSNDGSETVYAFSTSGNGSTSTYSSSTISQNDKLNILGPAFSGMTFAQIQAKDPAAAERLIKDKQHDMSTDEAKDFTGLLANTNQKSGVTIINATDTTAAEALVRRATGIPEVKEVKPDTTINSADLSAAKELVRLSGITNPGTTKSPEDAQKLSDAESLIKRATGTPGVKEVKPDTTINPADLKAAQELAAISSTALNSQTKNIPILISQKLPNGGETVQFKRNDGSIVKATFTAEEIKATGHKSIAEMYGAPGGPKNVEDLMKANPTAVAVTPENAAIAAANAQPVKDQMRYVNDGLRAAGKIDEGIGPMKVAKSLIGVFVNTAKDAAPYFQAYLKMKDQADNTQSELTAAMDKLAAASKKLKAIEESIDAFGGRRA